MNRMKEGRKDKQGQIIKGLILSIEEYLKRGDVGFAFKKNHSVRSLVDKKSELGEGDQ